MVDNIIKILFPFVIAFFVGVSITPIITNFLYKHKMWKKKAGKTDSRGKETKIFNKLHQDRETGTPRMGGLVIWGSALITISVIAVLAYLFPESGSLQKIDFLSRSQTWIPTGALILGALVGFIDDFLEVRGSGGRKSGGLSLRKRLVFVALLAMLVGSWFFFKLEVSSLGLPGGGEIPLGIFFVPFFILVVLGIYAGGIIDGIDGLSGGVFISILGAYAGIAFYQNQINLAAFCTLLVGSILAFLWFNIPPARFYMSETGSMALTIVIAIVAFMTDELGGGYGVLVLPIIAFPLVLTVLSVIIQSLSKRFRNGKKVFQVAPLHHHFEAIGWPSYKVTMRYWVISAVFASLGMIIAFMG